MRVRDDMDGLLSFVFHLGLRIYGSWLFIDVRKEIMLYLPRHLRNIPGLTSRLIRVNIDTESHTLEKDWV
jgi:hypothetical protein